MAMTYHAQDALNELIKERFDNLTEASDASAAKSAAKPAPKPEPEDKPTINGSSTPSPNGIVVPKQTTASASASPVKREAGSEDLSELEEAAPPKKKAKKAKPGKDEDDDAVYAAKLQAQLNNSARPTRGGGAKPVKATPKKKAPKKKSSAKISAADDSDIGSGGEDEKKTERGGAFNVGARLALELCMTSGC